MTADRRAFLGRILGLAAASRGGATASQTPGTPSPLGRQQQALQIRQDAAFSQANQIVQGHPINGDEPSLPAYIGNFTKGLPHTQLGEVSPGTYETLLHALSTGSQADFEAIDRGSGMKFADPLAAFAFQLEGADSHLFGTAPPFAFSSADAAGEMAELYWQALARDVPFTDYATSSVTQATIADVNRLSAFHGPVAGGQVTPGTLFRGNAAGALVGPYISQFFWKPVPVNSTSVQQLYWPALPESIT